MLGGSTAAPVTVLVTGGTALRFQVVRGDVHALLLEEGLIGGTEFFLAGAVVTEPADQLLAR